MGIEAFAESKGRGKVEQPDAFHVQRAVMDMWIRKHEGNKDRRTLAMEWTQNGMATAYRDLMESGEVTVDLEDEASVSALLERIEKTVH